MGLLDRAKKILTGKPKSQAEISRENYAREQREHEKDLSQEAYWAGRIGGAKAKAKKEGWAAGYNGRKSGALGVMEDLGSAFKTLENSPVGDMSLEGGSLGFGMSFYEPNKKAGHRSTRRERSARHKSTHKKAKRSGSKKSSSNLGLGMEDFL